MDQRRFDVRTTVQVSIGMKKGAAFGGTFFIIQYPNDNDLRLYEIGFYCK